MHQWQFLILVIGIFAEALAAPLAQATDVGSSEIELSEDGGSKKPGYIYVEPEPRLIIRDGKRELAPFADRRGRWGATIGVGYGTYEPTHYEPNFSTANFGDIYRRAEMALMALNVDVKRNVSFGSFGAGFTVGMYKNSSDVDPTIVDSTLEFYPVKLGATFYADALDSDPIFVPYVSGGMYTIFYNESQASASRNGHTQFAPWANLGVNISMNWIDSSSAQAGYDGVGLQNTALFLEAQKMMSSASATDPDFGNDVSFAAGLRIEF